MILLVCYWTAYFSIHSLLSMRRLKKKVSDLRPGFPYRLAYNILATILLFPGAWLLWGHPWTVLWTFQGFWKYLAYFMQFLAFSGFLFSLKYYDMKAFIGLMPDEGSFAISPFHRHVRHPWYALALVMIWFSDMNSGRLATAIMVTIYFFLGSKHEESMLIERFGKSYASYRVRVPGLIPLPWKYLTKEEAESLVK